MPTIARAGARHGNRQPPGAAAELEHTAVLRGGEPLPERDVAPRQGLRILPVVERGVVVPALPAFSHSRLALGELRGPLTDDGEKEGALQLDEAGAGGAPFPSRSATSASR